MNRVFVDTSALYALLVASDEAHDWARRAFARLAARAAALTTSSYVLVETYALLARRVGWDAVERFRLEFAPLLQVVWVDGELHEAGLDLLLERRWADLSLVDAVSFALIRRDGVGEAFALDRHFEREGLLLVSE